MRNLLLTSLLLGIVITANAASVTYTADDASTGMNKLNATVTVTGESEPPTPIGEAILQPATLNKANVSEYSEDMTWYNSDYFDFGPEDAQTQAFDILGRPVRSSYQGIIIRNGRETMRVRQ